MGAGRTIGTVIDTFADKLAMGIAPGPPIGASTGLMAGLSLSAPSHRICPRCGVEAEAPTPSTCPECGPTSHPRGGDDAWGVRSQGARSSARSSTIIAKAATASHRCGYVRFDRGSIVPMVFPSR